MHGQLRKPQHT